MELENDKIDLSYLTDSRDVKETWEYARDMAVAGQPYTYCITNTGSDDLKITYSIHVSSSWGNAVAIPATLNMKTYTYASFKGTPVPARSAVRYADFNASNPSVADFTGYGSENTNGFDYKVYAKKPGTSYLTVTLQNGQWM